jgi:hypothetical protein
VGREVDGRPGGSGPRDSAGTAEQQEEFGGRRELRWRGGGEGTDGAVRARATLASSLARSRPEGDGLPGPWEPRGAPFRYGPWEAAS